MSYFKIEKSVVVNGSKRILSEGRSKSLDNLLVNIDPEEDFIGTDVTVTLCAIDDSSMYEVKLSKDTTPAGVEAEFAEHLKSNGEKMTLICSIFGDTMSTWCRNYIVAVDVPTEMEDRVEDIKGMVKDLVDNSDSEIEEGDLTVYFSWIVGDLELTCFGVDGEVFMATDDDLIASSLLSHSV